MNNIPKCLANISPNWYDILSKRGYNDIVDRVFEHGTLKSKDSDSFYNDNEVFDINNNMNCMVGEAFQLKNHNVNTYDNCEMCGDFSMRFYRVFESDFNESNTNISDDVMKSKMTIGYNEDTLMTNIKEFCEHIKKKHPTILRDTCDND